VNGCANPDRRSAKACAAADEDVREWPSVNVVFDFGNVVFRWDPDGLLARLFDDPTVRQRLKAHLVEHPDWLALDRGTLSPGEAIERAARRAEVPGADVMRFLSSVPGSLAPIAETVELLHRVKAAGHWLYYLSNIHVDSIDHLERAHAFWELFEGGVASCRVRLLKPEPAIYAHLLSEYRLEPTETIFVDDLLPNVEAAAQFGISTVRFEDPVQCEAALVSLGCL